MKANLLLFVKAIFQEDTYHERPYFRGLYFSSAMESREVNPKHIELFGTDPRKSEEPEKAIFLVDLFKKILPGDRYLFQPTNLIIFIKRFIKSTQFLISSAVCFLLLLLISYAYFKSNVINNPAFPKPPWNITEDDLPQNLREFARLQSDIAQIAELNSGWLLPKTGLTTFFLSRSLDIEEDLKHEFADKFDDFTLPMLEQVVFYFIEQSQDSIERNDLRTKYIAYNIFKLLLIEDILKGRKPAAKDQFLYVSSVLLSEVSEIPEYARPLFGNLYCSYLDWLDNKEELETQRDEVQRKLQALFEDGSLNLDWLMASWIHETSDVRLADFWYPQEQESRLVAGEEEADTLDTSIDEIYIPGAFTNAGKERIDEFISSIEGILTDSEIIAEDMGSFWNDYNQKYQQAWVNFINRFDEGFSEIEGTPDQQDLFTAMTTDQNPYFSLLDQLGKELSSLAEDPTSPQWVTLAMELNLICKMGQQEGHVAQSGGVSKVAWKLYQGMEDGVIQLTDTDKHIMQQGRRDAAKVWHDYVHSLGDLAPIVVSPGSCYTLIFDDFAGESNNIHNSINNYLQLKNLFSEGENADLWNVVIKGPWRFLVKYGCGIVAEKLQQKWDSDVVSGSQEERHTRVQTFVSQDAFPFIERDESGQYRIATIDGIGVPFSDTFIEFLNRLESSEQRSAGFDREYSVNLSTQPPNVNPEARTLITEVVLEIPTAGFKWINFNRRGSKVFNWKPDASSDVELTIKVGDGLSLKKTYGGEYPFVKFLREFRQGQRIFKPRDFSSSERQQLSDLNITQMEIFYSFDREGSRILDAFRYGTTDIPQVIINQ